MYGKFLIFPHIHWVDLGWFEKLYNSAIKNKADIAAAGIIRQRRYSKKYRIFYANQQIANSLEEKLNICTSIGGDYCWNVWNKIYKKSFLLQNSIIFDENTYFEDVAFTIHSLHLSKTLITVPKVYYYYYARNNSIVKGIPSSKKRKDIISAYSKFYAYCLKNNIKISEKNSRCTKIYLKFFNLLILSTTTQFKNNFTLNNLKLFNVLTIFKYKKFNPYVCYDYPVDIVYTWCNDEQDFRNQKKLWLKKLNINDEEYNFSCQWSNNDELKYSIRSVEKYAPWLRNIYIVTNSQTPEWLINKNEKTSKNYIPNKPVVKIIDVRNIMPVDCLPTFNSQAIETCIPYIKGLSEHFLYSCDDMMFNQAADKSFFYNAEGKPIVRLGKKLSPKTIKKSLYARTVLSAQEKVKNRYNVSVEQAPHHCTDAYTKKIFTECINDYKEEFDKTTAQKFRTEDSIQRAVVLYRAIAKNQAAVKSIKLFGIFNRDSKCIALNQPQKLKYLNNKNIKLFCINDDSRATEKDKKTVFKFLENKFPQKSIYEGVE